MKKYAALFVLLCSFLAFAEDLKPVPQPGQGAAKLAAVKVKESGLELSVEEKKDIDLLRKDYLIALQAERLSEIDLANAKAATEHALQNLRSKVVALRSERKLEDAYELVQKSDPAQPGIEKLVFEKKTEGKQ